MNYGRFYYIYCTECKFSLCILVSGDRTIGYVFCIFKLNSIVAGCRLRYLAILWQ